VVHSWEAIHPVVHPWEAIHPEVYPGGLYTPYGIPWWAIDTLWYTLPGTMVGYPVYASLYHGGYSTSLYMHLRTTLGTPSRYTRRLHCPTWRCRTGPVTALTRPVVELTISDKPLTDLPPVSLLDFPSTRFTVGQERWDQAALCLGW